MQQQQFQNVSPKNKEIFKFIEELLVTYDFREAQITYFDKHCKSFENSEENKHFYHDLFKEYTEILDSTIDKKLAETFSESEIQEFYKDFTEDHTKYDLKNPWVNTVETLFTFTDFENFKQTMVDYYEREHKGKVAEIKPYEKLDVTPDFETFHQYFNKPTSEFATVLLGKNDEEVTSYTRSHNDTVQVFLSKYTINGVEEDVILKSFYKMDTEKIKAAFPFIKEMEDVQFEGEPKQDDVQTMYSLIEYPMMPKSDSLIRTEQGTFEDYKLVRQNSIEHEKFPVKEGIQRTEMYKQIYCRQVPGTKNTECVDITFAKREIGVPPMFLNMLIAKSTKTGVAYFFGELRAQQAEKDAKK